VAIIKKRLNLNLSLYTILQILSITLFEKVPVLQLLTNDNDETQNGESPNQLLLFDL
ncbi:MAG: IS4 family transposase, partial [bacterium]|nr:IS4 family transposase [bacterium]